jgi:hypothetical protein
MGDMGEPGTGMHGQASGMRVWPMLKTDRLRVPATRECRQRERCNDTRLLSGLAAFDVPPSATTIVTHSHRSRSHQARGAGARNRLYGFAVIFIAPATLFGNHDLTDTGIFGYPGHAGADGVFN